MRIYRRLYKLNRAFAEISHHCWVLEHAGLVPIVQMRVFGDFARELQSQISHAVIDKMYGVGSIIYHSPVEKRPSGSDQNDPEFSSIAQQLSYGAFVSSWK